MKLQKTYYPKADEINPEWILVDANGQLLGRLATQIASVLLGKHKTNFTPGVGTGDYVIVINARGIRVTGNKMEDKIYYHHTGYPGGIKSVTLRDQLNKHPERIIRSAVWGMLPHNKFGRKLIKRLKIFSGPDHHHEAQQPRSLAERFVE
jgi:large subunit ribosomal protein L13